MKESADMKSWDEMNNDERLDRLTVVLTRAGSDAEFRSRCLHSTESARQAVSEAGGIDFPSDFEVQFMTPKERLKKLILAVPDFIPARNGRAELRQAEDYQTCSYFWWRS